jgi:hypothetical protein
MSEDCLPVKANIDRWELETQVEQGKDGCRYRLSSQIREEGEKKKKIKT